MLILWYYFTTMKNIQKDFVSLLVIIILPAVVGCTYAVWRSNSVAKVTISEILTPSQSSSVQEKAEVNMPVQGTPTDIKPLSSSSVEGSRTEGAVGNNTKTIQKTDNVQVYVNVIDKDGQPLKPDTVEWYYPAVNGRVTQYPASCMNAGCTRWSVMGATSTKIYVTANYKVPSHPDALCFSSAYHTKLVELSSIPSEITLIMEPEKWCY